MESISAERRATLIRSVRDLLKIELLDEYGMDRHLLDAWRAGNHEYVERSAREYAEFVEAQSAKGWTFRRVRVVSEPLSDYQRMAVATCGPSVKAGEQLRWLSRREVSVVPLPGNDCFVLDGNAVIFNVHDGEHGTIPEIQYSVDPEVVAFCRETVEGAWARAVPHFDYRPS
ncbi:DUF6879 family protein [Streptosporangium saharense]|uniref:DUF6879 family protein n=1 Tax=Streptosporangium saharense TaxID=1706840 RepID=UPI00332B7FD1